MNMKHMLRTLLPTSVKKLIKAFPKYIFYWIPIQKNKIVFINFAGAPFGDNPKYICLEMVRQKLQVDQVWLLHNLRSFLPDGVRGVSLNSLRSFYELATAHVIIVNINNILPGRLKKKAGQIIIQTWHGSHGFKYIERQAEDTLTPDYISASKLSTDMTDIFISDGPENTQMYRAAFQCTCKIIETGMPREDILFTANQQQLDTIKDSLGIAKDKSILLYAPTFRDNKRTDVYNLDFDSILSALTQRFGHEWIILLRLHPNVKSCEINCDSNKIINVSSYGDPQELIAISDALITDYSSIYHDFFITEKPVFVYTPDLTDYITQNRHLKPSFFTMPWACNKDMHTLIENILHFDNEKYKKMVSDYRDSIGAIADGKASYRVVEYIKRFL